VEYKYGKRNRRNEDFLWEHGANRRLYCGLNDLFRTEEKSESWRNEMKSVYYHRLSGSLIDFLSFVLPFLGGLDSIAYAETFNLLATGANLSVWFWKPDLENPYEMCKPAGCFENLDRVPLNARFAEEHQSLILR